MTIEFPLASSGAFFAFESSNWAGKAIVFILLIASVFSWTVMWTKWSFIKEANRRTRVFMDRLRTARQPIVMLRNIKKYAPSPIASVFHRGTKELLFHLLGSADLDETFEQRLKEAPRIPHTSMTAVRAAFEQAVSEEALKLESQLILLASVVSGAPFLGLLGTVWGVMDAFSNVAMANTASLQVLAPGVSGALLTTVTGLLVAIPAMFGYNYLLTTIRAMTIEMENFAAESTAAFEHEFIEKR